MEPVDAGTMETIMSTDLRDLVWSSTHYLWYDSKYNTELASRMVDRLKLIDDVTKVLVALTATGSAVAGWRVWQSGGLAFVWAMLAGAAAVLSIVHSSLGIPARLKDWLETKNAFLGLRVSALALRATMEHHPDFDPDAAERALESLRLKFGEYEAKIPSDFFATSGLKLTCQNSVDSDIAGRMDDHKENN